MSLGFQFNNIAGLLTKYYSCWKYSDVFKTNNAAYSELDG